MSIEERRFALSGTFSLLLEASAGGGLGTFSETTAPKVSGFIDMYIAVASFWVPRDRRTGAPPASVVELAVEPGRFQ